MKSYRIFVSYSHDNQSEAEAVRRYLNESLNQKVMSDHSLAPGMPFTDEIKRYIAYSHLFIPVVTTESSTRPWVHQEVGYAMGLGIPVLPLAIGQIPEGMTHSIHAVTVAKDLNNLRTKLTADVIQHVVDRADEISSATSQCAQNLLDRTKLIVQYARDVRYLGESGRVRIRSAFGSFTVPKEHATHPLWDIRDGEHLRCREERTQLRKEREVLEEHARSAGCSMILEPETVKSHRPEATALRLAILVDFLKSMDDDKVSIAFQGDGKIADSLIVIGDWFLAEAIVPLKGDSYRLTSFTRHGPTVIDRVAEFDCELDGLLKMADLQDKSSRCYAIEYLEALIAKLRA
jgi:hypothetical protein